ncbi:Proteinase inhibitor I9, subtilisin propeptide [Metarhizium album ARSEF 1941]|uniref:Proteinase inhibitor I9, subtilisin propeptide n=1 Tax=Metarhizium album (strain ARSEF 1941) TaxID=1081103 RepID=A0A0B2WSZ3_METAS|nr:Proteinase inhibitor I9, subtilisin propeptide [Metarhizium album ARSEF 1941]KHN96080.1 Proteinase inhibitor I9, subtilisin propeptide [Metarhizium album ARSEF 1941]
MNPARWSLVLVPALLRLAAAFAPDTCAADDGGGLGYIVVLHQNQTAEHFESHIQWVQAIHEQSLRQTGSKDGNGSKVIMDTFCDNASFFCAYLADVGKDVMREIERSEAVDFVEPDRYVEFDMGTNDDEGYDPSQWQYLDEMPPSEPGDEVPNVDEPLLWRAR